MVSEQKESALPTTPQALIVVSAIIGNQNDAKCGTGSCLIIVIPGLRRGYDGDTWAIEIKSIRDQRGYGGVGRGERDGQTR